MNSRGRLLVAALAVASVIAMFIQLHRLSRPPPISQRADFLRTALKALQAYEEQQAREHWGPELLAEQYGRWIENLWDEVNHATNRWSVIKAVQLGGVILPRYGPGAEMPHGILALKAMGSEPKLNPGQWQEFLSAQEGAGWLLDQCEFRHISFKPGLNGPSSSKFSFSAHLRNPRNDMRAQLEGSLTLAWQGSPDAPEQPLISADTVNTLIRQGPPPFQKIFEDTVLPPPGSYFIDPLIIWDLEGDGQKEIILAAANRVYHRSPHGAWTASDLCDHDPGLIFTGLLGDIDGDSSTDFLCAKFEGLFLYSGSPDGHFRSLPRQVWSAEPHLKYAQALICGDVDNDGDLDVFLGQYKVPYDRGQMPRPYFDANDGYPSFLLENNGHGSFTDVTQRAGLGAKRARRIYNASFVDLDGDHRLDLVLVSDFAGLDAFRNDGSGRFEDATERWFPERHGFGMANCFSDFNRDGRIDVLMIGMNSPTVDRLEALGLSRPYEPTDDGMRSRVTFGNRLLTGRSDGTFRQSSMGQAIARTGWSWGCVTEDFDQDGFPDVYIANGHETRNSVRDYEPEFWLHDIYVGTSQESALAHMYFRAKFAQTRGRGWSYGGYEKNRFFFNLGGTNFLECGYLMGVALETDSRNALSEDIDRDGRADLILTTFETHPVVRQTLQIFHNDLTPAAPFTEVAISQEQSGGLLSLGSNYSTAVLSSGSFRSQSQPRLRGQFGEVEFALQKDGKK